MTTDNNTVSNERIDQQREEIERLRSLLVRALPCVASEAEMMDAMDRHAPLPEEDMPAVGAAADKLYILRNEIETALSSTATEKKEST